MLQRTPQAWPPNYKALFAWRQAQLVKMKESPEFAAQALLYYKTRPVEFISHWCDTFDPRNATTAGAMVRMPFILFKRQRELIEFFQACLQAQTSGLVEKSRTMGATWAACCFSVHCWLFIPGADIGWGSRKEDLVDKLGVTDSIFEKMRQVIRGLPPVFLPSGFSYKQHMPFMTIINPETNTTITGESGDNIGRGGRKLMYFKDESAHYERPEAIEAALLENTNVQMDISSVHGFNVFHRRREAGVDWEPGTPAIQGRTNVFVMDWRDHPEKTQAWYNREKKRREDEGLVHLFYQEVDRNYAASVEGIVIQPEWVLAAIDAHKKLPSPDWLTGDYGAALDVADSGTDRNALTQRKNVVLLFADEWGARDVGVTTRRTVDLCKPLKEVFIQYDCIGVGAGVKSEVNRLNEEKDSQGNPLIPIGMKFVSWDAGSSPLWPEDNVIPEDFTTPVNKDFYHNLKAQGWWLLGRRFEKTAKCIEAGRLLYPVSELISISSKCPRLQQIKKELSQPVRKPPSGRMKLVIDKLAEGQKSPNIGDSIMMNYHPCDPGYDASLRWV